MSQPTQPTQPAQPTQPNVLFEKFSNQLRAHIKKAFQMGVDAAQRADADDFGIDDRISVAHKFVDLEVKGHAEMLKTLIAGPWITPAPTDDSNTATVPAATSPRNVELGRWFRRVGWDSVTIGRDKLSVTPKVLPAGATKVTITLLDLNYIGANYRGNVKLTDPKTGQVDLITVTVGL